MLKKFRGPPNLQRRKKTEKAIDSYWDKLWENGALYQILVEEVARPYLELEDTVNLALTCRFFAKSLQTAIKAKAKKRPILVAIGEFRTFVYKDNILYKFERRDHGQLELTYSMSLKELQHIARSQKGEIKSIVAGRNHTLILFTSGEVLGYGANMNGQLGLGNVDYQRNLQLIPLPENRKARYIAAGNDNTFIVLTDGTLWGCGENDYGQLGSRYCPYQKGLQRIVLPKGKGEIKLIAPGFSHTLILLEDGEVLGCGSNTSSQLGLDASYSMIFRSLDLKGNKAQQIAVGSFHSLVLLEKNEVWGCGSNTSGQLGLGDNVDYQIMLQPIDFGRRDILSISAEKDYTFVLFKDGTLLACGGNHYGQLGLEKRSYYKTLQPIILYKEKQVRFVATGSYYTVISYAEDDGLLYGFGNSEIDIVQGSCPLQLLTLSPLNSKAPRSDSSEKKDNCRIM
jgi:alpha-tubulin suppressor-like RCC1 family protein